MSIYNCEHCDKWLDNDYFPAEFITIVHESADKAGKRAHESAEYPLCEDCFIEYIEEKENENEQV